MTQTSERCRVKLIAPLVLRLPPPGSANRPCSDVDATVTLMRIMLLGPHSKRPHARRGEPSATPAPAMRLPH
jgi:hypothetical protein